MGKPWPGRLSVVALHCIWLRIIFEPVLMAWSVLATSPLRLQPRRLLPSHDSRPVYAIGAREEKEPLLGSYRAFKRQRLHAEPTP